MPQHPFRGIEAERLRSLDSPQAREVAGRLIAGDIDLAAATALLVETGQFTGESANTYLQFHQREARARATGDTDLGIGAFMEDATPPSPAGPEGMDPAPVVDRPAPAGDPFKDGEGAPSESVLMAQLTEEIAAGLPIGEAITRYAGWLVGKGLSRQKARDEATRIMQTTYPDRFDATGSIKEGGYGFGPRTRALTKLKAAVEDNDIEEAAAILLHADFIIKEKAALGEKISQDDAEALAAWELGYATSTRPGDQGEAAAEAAKDTPPFLVRRLTPAEAAAKAAAEAAGSAGVSDTDEIEDLINELKSDSAALRDAFTTQEIDRPADVFLRHLQGQPSFQQASPFVQAGQRGQARDAFSRFLISKLGAPGITDPETGLPGVSTQTFFDFLGQPRPTPNVLRSRLRTIQEALQPFDVLSPGFKTTAQETAIRGKTGFGGEEEEAGKRRFLAAIQPVLAEISPALRSAFYTGAEDLFNRFRSARPNERFLDFARQQGFF